MMSVRILKNNNYPVVVIGAGAGGLPAAVALAESGIKTILIERGGELDLNAITTDRYDYELQPQPWRQYHQEWHGPFEVQRGIGLGGSTRYFQAVSHLPSESVISAWGLPVALVRKTSQEVAQFLQIAGEIQPSHALNPVSAHLYQAAKDLKWRARPAPVAILSKPHGDRPQCNNCGLCIYGCKPRDKSSTNNTWLPRLKNNPNAQILTHTEVTLLELKDPYTVTALQVTGPQGRYSIPVQAVVLAAGALESPFLLKRSQQPQAPHGIGNTSVGRYLTGSLWHSLLVVQPQTRGGGYAGIPTDLLIEEFKEQGIMLFQSRNMAGITGPVSAAKFYAYHFKGNQCREWMKQNYERLAGLAGFAESSTDYRDGLLNASQKKFQKPLRAEDIAKTEHIRTLLLKWAMQAKSEILMDSGSVQHSVSGAMLRGTCRIGNDPSLNATANDGRLHGYHNIVVCDASVLGRGVIADPSWLLQTLGLLFGRQLADRIKNT